MFKLEKLCANKDSFHTINFKNGLNVIMGKPIKKNAENKKSTTNGIGKSLIIKIIDFCLGSDKVKEWEIPLRDWVFLLEINIDGEKYVIKRAVCNQNKIIFNDEELSVQKFRNKIRDMLCISPDFTFRQIINRFLRKGKVAYNTYLTSVPKEKESSTLLVLSYLLGMDYKLCQDKIDLKKKLDSSQQILLRSQRDPSFRELFGLEKCDIDLELGNIEFEIEKLEKELLNKNYAENYSEIQMKADNISTELDNLNNKRFIIESSINVIQEALSRKIEVDMDDIIDVYKDANIIFSEQLKHSLREVEDFHVNLLSKRREMLSKDLLKMQAELSEVLLQIKENNEQLNESLEFLRAHSAVDKYVVAVRQIDSLKVKHKELLRISNLEKDLKTKIAQIKTEIANSNIKAQVYLDSIETKKDELNKQFVALAKTFYINKKSALTIKVNDGDNQKRFDIDARITSDGADGIQEVITFCFDWVLLMQNITKQSFIYHDSLLLANVEKRQKEILFEIVESLCGEKMQYIININEDQIEKFSDDTRKIIDNNTVLTLTDENISMKLLGIEVDLGREIE